MAPNRITRGGATPPALAPIALALALALVALLAGCGSGSSSSSSAPASAPGGSAEVAASGSAGEESPDAPILNAILSRQEAVVDAYAAAIPHLAPPAARMASYFRAQEAEHVDGTLKAMRGSERIAAEPQAEAIDPGERKTERDWLVFLYEVESVTIDQETNAIGVLEGSLPRTVLTSTVANQAQHLVLLRRSLGAAPLASVPGPFENGSAEPPG